MLLYLKIQAYNYLNFDIFKLKYLRGVINGHYRF